MTSARITSSILAVSFAVFSVLTLALVDVGKAKAAFEPGLIEVTGYAWSVVTPKVDVQLQSIDGSGNQKYSVRQILEEGQGRADGQYDLATIPGISVATPGGGSVSCSGNDIRAERDSCPVFSRSTEHTLMTAGGGAPVSFTSNPVIRIRRQADMKVVIDPRKRTIKSGDSVTFSAKVKNPVGVLSYKWRFGDGSEKTTSSSTISHVFRGEDQQFSVTLSVSSSASPTKFSFDSALITIGKLKEKPKKKKKKPEKQEEPADNSSDPYDYGYGGSYGDGGGTGYPSTGGSPRPSPKTPKEKKSEPPVDNGLDTVTGQLVDPSQIAAVVPSGNPATEEQPEAEPKEVKSGGIGISDGAMTAIGVGALLGLGGLAEAGAFAGLRRFRLRP